MALACRIGSERVLDASNPLSRTSAGVPMTWRSSEDDENKVPSPTRPFSVGEGQGEGGQSAPGIFEREGRGEGTEVVDCREQWKQRRG